MAGMADEHLMSLQPGTVIAGRYEVVKCLGAGSMGLVYACRHKELSGHLVAVKVLFPEVAQDKVAAARFRNEIFASYGVSHPNVVRAYEYLRDGDLVAYTMEYVGGGDLADRLGKPRELMPISECVDLLSQMCLGVQAIHDAGIVHRDLKPENILLSKDNQVKIADFGIARMGHGPKLTEHGGVVGTIDYVSPEYMLNSHVDWRSDIYAVGILAYEMLTGESPFRGDSVYATMTKRLKTDAKPPSELRPECPKELDKIILRAMARDPEVRYQSMMEMFEDLQQLGGSAGSHSAAHSRTRREPGKYVGPTLPREENGPVNILDDDPIAESGNQPRVQPAALSSGAERKPFVENPSGIHGKSAAVRSAFEPAVHQERVERQDASRNKNYPAGISRINNQSEESAEVERTRVVAEPAPGAGAQSYAEPQRLQSVLGRSNAGSLAHQQRFKGQARSVSVDRGGIDTDRMQRLSELVETVNRSIWIDILTWVVAVIIGVGVGFAFIKLFFPYLVNPGSRIEASYQPESNGESPLV